MRVGEARVWQGVIEVSLSYLPASKEVGQGNGMNSFSSFICPLSEFFLGGC